MHIGIVCGISLPRKRISSLEYISLVRGRAASIKISCTRVLSNDNQSLVIISVGSMPVILDSV